MTARIPALLLVALLLPASGATAARCPGGRFTIAAALRTTDAPIVGDAVVVDGRTVTLDGCGPAHLHAHRARGGMSLRARWSGCAAVDGTVRLKARIDRACGRITGIVRVGGGAPWRFLGIRAPVCGNGIREGDEQCDAQDACCSSTCELTDAPGCAPVACASSRDCAADAYCAHDTGCDGPGSCHPRPDACVGLLEPACGCDGRTYVNACEATRAGVDVAHGGRCARTCGTIAGVVCPEQTFCEFPPGTCGAADLAGTCLPIPDACTREYRPVCGCDGTTYANDCTRRAAGVPRLHGGACGCDPPNCGPRQRPVDNDGDGCSEACFTPCTKDCDCYVAPPPLPMCPLDCATCGAYFACEHGLCTAHCGPVPPGQGVCETPPG